MNGSIALILLAAGNSKRFDGDKLAYALDGVPLLSRALRLYADPFFDKVLADRILVTQPERAAFCSEAEALGFRVVQNNRPEEGISRSIRLGVQATMEKQPAGILFSVADQPFLTEKTVYRLLERFQEDPSRIVAPASDGKRGNPVVFPAAFAAELANLHGDIGGSAVIRKHADLLDLVETDGRELKDVDLRTEV